MKSLNDLPQCERCYGVDLERMVNELIALRAVAEAAEKALSDKCILFVDGHDKNIEAALAAWRELGK